MTASRLGFPLFVVAALVACTNTTLYSDGGLKGPASLAIAPGPDGKDRVFIANADGAELRVYDPATRMFVRGANAISPLALLVGFRPSRLAVGSVSGPDAASHPFLLVGGAARAITVVDPTTYEVTVAGSEKARCESDPVVEAAGCLRGAALDVAATAGRAVAVLEAPPEGSAALAVFAPSLEDGAPVLALSNVLDLPGNPRGVALSADGATAWVADLSAARVLVVHLGNGTIEEIAVAGPSRDVFPVPAYVTGPGDARAAELDALVTLVDGRLQTVSLADKVPAADPFEASSPAFPLDFGSPVNDVAFVPCPATTDGSPCRVTLRQSSAITLAAPLLAFVALSDGNVAAIEPDTASPQLFRPINMSTVGPAISLGTTKDPLGVVVNTPALATDATSLTAGVTPSDAWGLGFETKVPGFLARGVAIEARGDGLGLVDGGGQRDRLVVGDEVTVTASSGCAALKSGVSGVLAGFDDAELRVTPSVAVDPTCLPVSGIVTVRATAEKPWILTGAITGFSSRLAAGERHVVTRRRSYYPSAPTSGPAFAFTIGTETAARETTITFSTSSGLTPFTFCQLAYSQTIFASTCATDPVGFATAVVSTPTQLYATLLATPYLLEFVLPNYLLTDSIRAYR